MKRKRYTEPQIVFALQQTQGLPLAGPGEGVALGSVVHLIAEGGFELVEVHLAFGEGFGEEAVKLLQALGVRVGRGAGGLTP